MYDHEHHFDDLQVGGRNNRLNWLRAGVLGANDGIVSVAAIAVGVAGATPALAPILTAGVAGLVGGAVSMALGEYVSVSSQRDSEHAMIAEEQRELAEMPHRELAELAHMYRGMGLSAETARQVAVELTANDPLRAHLAVEQRIDLDDIVSPWRAALASAVAFLAGGALPLLAIVLSAPEWRVPVTFVAVLVALAITGAVGGYLGRSPMVRPAVRVVLGGALALAATYLIGTWIGATGLV